MKRPKTFVCAFWIKLLDENDIGIIENLFWKQKVRIRIDEEIAESREDVTNNIRNVVDTKKIEDRKEDHGRAIWGRRFYIFLDKTDQNKIWHGK